MKRSSRSITWLTGLSLLTTLGACAVVGEGDDPPDETQTESELGGTNVRWVATPMTGVVQVQMTHNHDGSLAAFARTTGGGLVFDEQTSPGGGWTAPVSLGGWGLQDFAVAEQQDGRLVVFALGGDGAIYAQTQNAPSSTAFSGWSYLAGHDLKDVAAARQADGKVVMLALGADHYVYERLQSAPNGGFDDWSWVGGTGDLIQIAMAPQASGRLALLGRTINGEIMFTNQPTLNANFLGWTTLDGWQLKDFSLARNADGRLEVVAIGGDSYVYDKPQAQPDLGWNNWFGVGVGGVTNLATTLAGDGSLDIFMIGGDQQVHRVAQNGPGAGLVTLPAMGGNHLTQVTADHDTDGRLEVMGLGADHVVYQTWQTSPGGSWLTLPVTPGITYTTATPNPADVGTSVTVSWTAQIPNGCSSYSNVTISSPLQGNNKPIGSWNGSSGASASFTIKDDTTVQLTVGCYEGLTSGTPIESKVHWTVKANKVAQNVSYVDYLSAEHVWEGAVPYSHLFGQMIQGGKLISIKNQNLYAVYLIKANAPNSDCTSSNAIGLAPQQTTSPAQIQTLYGSTTPALPVVLRACPAAQISGYLPITVNYTY